ncbi:adenine phosphoribosyltransferase [Trichosporon asahii var. asahii CBS 8904]|uniref:adenine phosphoribosyltransferase n=1 Tax=Trichosporon asahii var. asahii (strain CBS 8904) TaxID=1220162 RepID=K1V3I2_TRIAC|nr:adenine phosphoribosyltransferase [Trichosporon asahii var. asahii CBS 8904]
MSDVAFLKSCLGQYPDWPKKGVTFLDIFPILRDPYALETLVTHLVSHITQQYTTKPDVIVGLDARGFLLGPIIAMRLGAAFVPVRKAGKLPGQCEVAEFEKEYGVDRFEMQKGAIKPGQTVIVFEAHLLLYGGDRRLTYSDLIATGGSAAAAGELIKKEGGKTLEYIFIVGLPFLKGHERLDAPAYWMVEAED